MKITIQKNIQGSILDIGGGGEGIIGRVYGQRVIAIDNQQEELDEAPNCCEKRLMDASYLLFSDQSFDNVTFFYSLMFMTRDIQEKAIHEANRVLKQGGRLFIWDSNIRNAYPDPHVVHLDIHLDQMVVHTSYGIIKDEGQSCEEFESLITRSGLSLESVSKTDDHFLICAQRG